MCGWSFEAYMLSARSPATWVVAGTAVSSLLGASWALRGVWRRGRAEPDPSELDGEVAAEPRLRWRSEIAAVLSLLLVPLSTLALVSLGRRQVAACLREGLQAATNPFDCMGGGLGMGWPTAQLDLLGLGAALWIPALLLSALALGLAGAQRLRARQRSWAHEALGATPPATQLRYRSRPHHDRERALRWLLRHPTPSARGAAIVALLLAVAVAALASGASHVAWSFRDGMARVRWPADAQIWDLVVDEAYGTLTLHAVAALVLLGVTMQVALVLRGVPAPESLRAELARLEAPSSRLRRLSSGVMALAAVACLLAAQPLRAQSTHPLPTFVSAARHFSPPEELDEVMLPDLVGPDTLVDAPELVVDRHGRATLHGSAMANEADLEETAALRRGLWQSRFPNREPLGMMTVAADRRLPLSRLSSLLAALLRAGYPWVQLRFETMHELDPPTFDGWTHAYRDSALVVRLAAERDLPTSGSVSVSLDSPSPYGQVAAMLSRSALAGQAVYLSLGASSAALDAGGSASPAARRLTSSSISW